MSDFQLLELLGKTPLVVEKVALLLTGVASLEQVIVGALMFCPKYTFSGLDGKEHSIVVTELLPKEQVELDDWTKNPVEPHFISGLMLIS